MRTRALTFLLACLLPACLAIGFGCETESSPGGSPAADARTDAGSADTASVEEDTETPLDAEDDGHAIADAFSDAVTDAATDTAADTEADDAADTEADAATDTEADAATDTEADATTDTEADTEADTAPDPPPALCEGTLAPMAHETTADETFPRGPYLQSVTESSAVVVWRAPDATEEGCVTWQADDDDATAGAACGTQDASGQVEVLLEGLPPGAAVTYAATHGEATAGPFTFHTAPAAPTPTRLLVYADAHASDGTLRTIATAALEAGVDGAVGVGDHVSQPEEDQWQRYFEGLRALGHRVPIWPVIGNHENKHPSYFNAFVVPGAAPPPRQAESWYSVRWGNVWMGSLELDDIAVAAIGASAGIETPESAWLKAVLASDEAQTARWRLLFIHQPPYAEGWGTCDHYQGEGTLRAYLVPLAAEHRVAAIFSGHVHGWERGEDLGVALVTTGGAGGGLDIECPAFEGLPDPWYTTYEHHFTLVDAECDRLIVEARGLDGTTLDRFEIPYAP